MTAFCQPVRSPLVHFRTEQHTPENSENFISNLPLHSTGTSYTQVGDAGPSWCGVPVHSPITVNRITPLARMSTHGTNEERPPQMQGLRWLSDWQQRARFFPHYSMEQTTIGATFRQVVSAGVSGVALRSLCLVFRMSSLVTSSNTSLNLLFGTALSVFPRVRVELMRNFMVSLTGGRGLRQATPTLWSRPLWEA